MNESITIVLKLPHKLLSPNYHPFSRQGRFGVMAETRKQKAASIAAIEAQRVETMPWEKATVQATYYHAQKRKRDGVNFNQRFKAAQDGITESGLILNDDYETLTTLPPKFEIDKDWPRLELEIVRVK